jgi:outer membrane receptor protein involved in Fe transport
MNRIFYICFYILLLANSLFSKENERKVADAETLFNMSFEDLLNLNVVSSSFIGIDKIKEPASVTLITSDDIALTPHRNLYDLLEVYVPGAIWMTHYDSPHIGIRGIINQRNDKILLLVNGKNMNFKAHNGATSELENWDLSDIDKIEIIRGPGSVIYGPGAVEAVINITTKNFSTGNNHISLGTVYPYSSNGGHFSFNHEFNDKIKLFAFGSVISTKGYYPEKGFYIGGNASIYDLELKTNTRPYQDYFVDSEDRPQIKAHIQLDIDDNTSLWVRYTRAGTIVNGLTSKLRYQTGFDPDTLFTLTKPVNFNQAKNEQFVIAFNKNMDLGDDYILNAFLCFDSENNSRAQDYIQNIPKQYAPPEPIMKMLQDPNSLRNRYFAVSESEALLRALVTKTYNDNLSIAAGFEYSYNFWGKSWFKEDGYFRLGDNWNILSDKNSPAYGWKDNFGTDTNDTYFVGNGWGTNTISIFGEANYVFNNHLTMILSGRLDKDDYSHLMFSPRLALIHGFDDCNYLKFIAQRSVRMNTAEELFIQHNKQKDPEDEKIYNLELIYTSLQNSNFVFNISSFISWLDILTWKDALRTTLLSGKLNLYGLELEGRYHNNFIDISLNHAYIKQISWKLEPGVNQSGISYSDYYTPISGSVFTSIGNDLNNWSNNTTKLIVNFRLIEEVLLLHFDSRLYWGFQGAKDGQEMLRRALPGSKDSLATSQILDLIAKYDTYGPDFRLNASIRFNPIKNLTLSINAMNILDVTNNRRLRYDTGSKEEKWNYYMKNSMIIEPFTIGVGLSYIF